MPFCTIGFAVSDPKGATPTAAFPVSLNVQAGASLDTFAEEIVDPMATRVFARSPFAYGQEPDASVVDATTLVLMVLHPALAATGVLPGLLPPQAATSNPAATSSTARSDVRRFVLGCIAFTWPVGR